MMFTFKCKILTSPEKVSTDQLSCFLHIGQQSKKKKKLAKSHKTKPVLQVSVHVEEMLEKVQPFYSLSRVQAPLMCLLILCRSSHFSCFALKDSLESITKDLYIS